MEEENPHTPTVEDDLQRSGDEENTVDDDDENENEDDGGENDEDENNDDDEERNENEDEEEDDDFTLKDCSLNDGDVYDGLRGLDLDDDEGTEGGSGSGSGDDISDGVSLLEPIVVMSSEEQGNLLETAEDAFQEGLFDACIEALETFQKVYHYDKRVKHALALAYFCKANLRNGAEFFNIVRKMCKEQEIELENMECFENMKYVYIYYTYCTLLFYRRQFNSAMKMLGKMAPFLSNMDGYMRAHFTLLVANVQLSMYKPKEALETVEKYENLRENEHDWSLVPTIKILQGIQMNKEGYKDIPKPPKEIIREEFKKSTNWRMAELKCRCYLKLNDNESAGKQLEILSEGFGDYIPDFDQELDMKEARIKNAEIGMKFHEAYLECQKDRCEKSFEIMEGVELPQGLENFKLTGDSIPLTYYNNMGCLNLYAGKPRVAALYFRKALEENKKNVIEVGSEKAYRFVCTLGSSQHVQIVHNLGLALLHSGDAVKAFDCFAQALQVYHANPRLWLRLAECCIMVHKAGNEGDFEIVNKRKEILQDIVGSDQHRKLVLNLKLFEENKYCYDAPSLAIPVLGLEFATLCLRNVLLLSNGMNATAATAAAETATEDNVDDTAAAFIPSGGKIDCSPGNPPSREELLTLRCTALAKSAYVYLCLGNPIVALNQCKNLLSITDCPPTIVYIAHLYSAEALLLMNRIPEAIEHLKPDYSNYIEAKDFDKNVARPWVPDSEKTAEAVFQYNLAVVLTIKGDYGKASQLLQKIWTMKNFCQLPVQIISLALYIELSLGNEDIACNIVRQNCPKYMTRIDLPPPKPKAEPNKPVNNNKTDVTSPVPSVGDGSSESEITPPLEGGEGETEENTDERNNNDRSSNNDKEGNETMDESEEIPESPVES